MTTATTDPVVALFIGGATPDPDVSNVLTGWAATEYVAPGPYLLRTLERLTTHLNHWLDEQWLQTSTPPDASRVVAEVVRCLSVEHHANRLQWWGEDGDRIAEPGHVRLESFAEAAHALIVRDLAGSDLPGMPNAAEHIWIRPLTEDYAVRVYHVTPERARQLVAGGESYEPCGADDDGAQPFTVIDLDV